MFRLWVRVNVDDSGFEHLWMTLKQKVRVYGVVVYCANRQLQKLGNDSRDDDKPTGSSITCDHAKGTEEGMPQPVDPEVCTDLHVTEDHDPSNDATLQETEMQSLNTELETKEEPLRETTPLTTAQQDATTLMDQEMETSHVPDSLLDISNTPIMVAHATTDFVGQKSNNFLKGCKWYN